MPIEEKQVGHQWEVNATGDDIGKLRGMLTPTGNEAYQEAFHKDERAHAGHGHLKIMSLMPELPWPQKCKPGRYKYNPETKQMEAI